MIKKISITLIIMLFLISCSSNKETKDTVSINSSPEILYIEAMAIFKNNDFEGALIKFKEIESKYPLSNEAVQSQIMSGFIDYLSMEYESAIFKYNRVIQKYPSHKNIDYVFYIKAMCYFEQISHEELDSNNNMEALENFEQVILRFPESDYAKDSKLKIILVKENIAAKHMDVGRFYMKNDKYIAAMNRFKIVIEEFAQTKFTPEALFRLVEIYYKLGMIEEANKTAAVIAYNYPDSKWYQYSYNILGIEKNNDETQNLFNKVKKLIKNKKQNGKESE
ncbi:MAG: outer membrane protein assembly factor BamD [Rickettsiales bacterium]|nr:outer membrane protein assembly factor BamD [Rickettsiales bacterium]|tara:strand:+ start:844 stop:1680 length:837 start_codon:yes stop_codon:yes gene_type:complete